MTQKTFLTHIKDCIGPDGPVVMDTSKSTKLISPAYSLTQEGVTNPVLDVQFYGNTIIPVWECIICHRVVPEDLMPTHMGALCQVCGVIKPVSDLFVQSQIPSVCTECISKIKANKKGENVGAQIKQYCELYGLTDRTKFVTLLQVLKQPIQI